MQKVLVCGAGGFIGHHLVTRLKKQNYWVRGVDVKYNPYSASKADEFLIGDLRNQTFCQHILDNSFDEVYQLAADMGGAGYIFEGSHDAEIMHNSASINLNILESVKLYQINKIFYASSACIYPEYNQRDPLNPKTCEESAYPAAPDSEYGWEKLFSERLYLAYARCYGIQVRIARFHNIFGPEGSWNDGKEKSIAAISRKIAMAENDSEIEIWGDGEQTRSYLFIEECLEGIERLMKSNYDQPINIGSEEMISINELARTLMKIAGKDLTISHVKGHLGVRGRNSDNKLIEKTLGWKPNASLISGLEKTYTWINHQVSKVKIAV